MRIAVINETSTADRNADIMAALAGRGLEVYNVGNKKNGEKPELSYIQTGLMSALLLNAGRVDLVVGGCGTGQGYMISAGQYPGVMCGHIITPLDAWLFAQINAGNCISLMLNQGYGWAANINLKMVFDQLFSVEWGGGYPPHRAVPQREYRGILETVSRTTHRSMAEIVEDLADEALIPALTYPGFWQLLDPATIEDVALRTALLKRLPESDAAPDAALEPATGGS